MTRVLVTGGSGVLGSELVPRLVEAGQVVRVLSRRARPATDRAALEWAVGDLASGAGLSAALEGVDTVVHAASSPARDTQPVDVDGTQRLIEAARAAGAGHLIYISIVGIDRHPLPYYQHKLQAEQLVEAGAVPWTVLRTTQFFELLDTIFTKAASQSKMLLPIDYQYQPLAASEAAAALVQAVVQGPGGRLADMGGPEVTTAGVLAKQWLAAQGLRRRVFRLRVAGPAAEAYRAGTNTVPERAVGKMRWAEWLAARYGSAAGRQTASSPF